MNAHRNCAPKCCESCSYVPQDAVCPVCDAPLIEHIGNKPCVQSPPNHPRGLYDLPIFGWAWSEDGKDKRS